MKTIAERPILFSTPMVEAILAGRKTQTRRVFKGIGKWSPESLQELRADPDKAWAGSGYPDSLWVRETFHEKPDGSVLFKAGLAGQRPVSPWKPSIFMPRRVCRLILRVTGVRLERVQDISEADAIAEGIDWRRVDNWTVKYSASPSGNLIHYKAQDAYRELWDRINAKRGHVWSDNPWVWVIDFEARGARHAE